MNVLLENKVLVQRAKTESASAIAALAPVPTNLYNLTSKVLTIVKVGGMDISPNPSLAALAPNAAPSFYSFSVAGDSDLSVMFADGTGWTANLNVSLLAAGARLNLWCALNGFVGSTGTGNLQQLSWTAG